MNYHAVTLLLVIIASLTLVSKIWGALHYLNLLMRYRSTYVPIKPMPTNLPLKNIKVAAIKITMYLNFRLGPTIHKA
jgi:hypothetical protein